MLRLACFAASVAALAFVCPAFGAARICTSADTLSFGEQFVGTSASARVTVSNCGDAPFSFTDVSPHAATNPGFRVQTSCTTGSPLAPGASCDATIAFAPTTPGHASGAIARSDARSPRVQAARCRSSSTRRRPACGRRIS